jgi:hypothetical protein
LQDLVDDAPGLDPTIFLNKLKKMDAPVEIEKVKIFNQQSNL